jgi:predicted helicase
MVEPMALSRKDRFNMKTQLLEGLGTLEAFSLGVTTSRDSWAFNYSRHNVALTMKKTIDFYNAEVDRFGKEGDGQDPKTFIDYNPTKFSWDRINLKDLTKGRKGHFDPKATRVATYRPFMKCFMYFDPTNRFNNCVYQMPKIFPTPAHGNRVIMIPVGPAAASFSALMLDSTPALTPNGGNQNFPLYTYEPVAAEAQGFLFDEADPAVVDGYRRKDNITDATLAAYRAFYEDSHLHKEDIFYYVYGLLHSPAYKEHYKADLMKMLPRVPKVKDFWGFSDAGRALAKLHLDYETVPPYPLEEITQGAFGGDEYDFYRVDKLSFGARKDRSSIIYNQWITLGGIPDGAHNYQVNGKSALEWIIDRYQVTTHKDSRITNDPNDYCREIGNPRYILELIKRIVTVSVETMKIVAQLPALEVAE